MARRALAIEPISDHYDTLACAQAFAGDFEGAVASAGRALDVLPREDRNRGAYEQRATFETTGNPIDLGYVA